MNRSTTAFIFFVFAMVIPLLPGCRTEPSAESSPQQLMDVFVRYLHPDQAYKVQVSFSTIDTSAHPQPATIEGEVIFQGNRLSPRILGDQLVRYEANFNGPIEEALTLQVNAEKNWTLQYTQSIPYISGITISPAVDREGQFDLSIRPPTLAENDMLVLLFSDLNNQAASITLKGPQELNGKKISGQPLQKLAPGPGRVYAVRKSDKTHTLKNIHLRWSSEFYTNEQPIDIQ